MKASALTHDLERAVSALAPPFAHAAVAIARRGKDPIFALASGPGIPPMTAQSAFRAASISKIVTGQTVWAVLAGHPGAADADAAEILGVALRHPSGAPATPRQLLCHGSGLWDEAGYLSTPGQSLADWLGGLGGAIWSPDPPGRVYRYCNLGYILAAACAERLAGQRFDQLAQAHVLRPHWVEAGFNWAGLDARARRQRIACYRRDATGQAIAQIDETVAETGASGPGGDVIALDDLAPGAAALALSPQGGLRISLDNALRLALAIPSMDQARLWSPETGHMDDPTGVVDAYGPGLMFHDRPDFYPRPLVGHFANAYGFCGGLWYDAARDAAFVIALNGLPIGEEADDLRPEERALFAAVARALED